MHAGQTSKSIMKGKYACGVDEEALNLVTVGSGPRIVQRRLSQMAGMVAEERMFSRALGGAHNRCMVAMYHQSAQKWDIDQ
jgi:hypothetical protein